MRKIPFLSELPFKEIPLEVTVAARSVITGMQLQLQQL